MEEALASLRLDPEDFLDAEDFLDEQGPPVYRSGAFMWEGGEALSTETGGVDHGQKGPECMSVDACGGWQQLDEVEGIGEHPPARLVVSLTPHRIEPSASGEEQYVCSLRQFTVSVALLDGASGMPLSSSDAHLRASLVFADTGEPVPAQHGEAPLAGETDGKRPHDGACELRLRVAAQSYRHSRRLFAVRVDADRLPGGGGGFACSQPIRAVARLPNETKASVKPAAAYGADAAPDLLGSAAAPPSHRARGGYTYTSHDDLLDELKVQGDMLQRVRAQQQFILNELARIGATPGAACGAACGHT